ncbi:DeoR/GlpR family DNA-binding transcription regulator [Microbacterium telephonicum]|uniref:Lactose phosphotransferase system repressor n=1 Tax=Microbacterium telephonicum TaxID=1714841 RepID=A0A498C4G7_9MICO|nr:DeoR/GlpR family DNA-binding transcription regulator [Microbacterium telephonicum]RLK49386.1 DeoR family transcriptional regulator [Microbacterium telephonicum]
MYATERHEHIAQLIAAEGRVSVVDLARRFDVTTETVRRDLDQLGRTGVVRRVHGGAVSRTRVSTAESSFAERALVRGEAKEAIARAALALMPDDLGGSVYLDAGTTTAALAAHLAAAAQAAAPLEVVTHSMTVAHLLAGVAGLQVTAVGGRVRGLTAAAVGAGAVAAVSRLRPDVAFVGTNGLSASLGLSTPDPDEAAVKEAIVRGARRVVVLADSEKFEAELLVSFAPLDEIDVVVTDAAPTGPLAEALAAAGVEVVVA